jgi:hypothetical protein
MIRALAHPVRARVLARGRERDTRARVVVLARASDANDDDDDDEALEREFARIRAKTEKAKKIPLSPRERAALADEWSLECRNIGLSHLERCFRARADAQETEGRRDDDDVGGDGGDWNG